MTQMRLVGFDKKYLEIEKQWKTFVKHIESSFSNTQLKSYAKNACADVNNEIRFKLCGMECYIEFAHDFSNGFLRYGIVKKAKNGEYERRIFKAVPFDRLGNLDGEWVMDSENDALQLHGRMLLQIIEGMHAEYYGMDKQPKGEASTRSGL